MIPPVNPFWNEREKRLPAFWRLLLQVSLLVIIGLVLGSLVSGGVLLLGVQMPGSEAGLLADPFFFAVNYAVSFVAVVASVWLAARFLDRRPFSGFGLSLNKDWWLDFGFGLFLGALLMTGIFLVELAAGWVTVAGTFEAAGGGAFFPIYWCRSCFLVRGLRRRAAPLAATSSRTWPRG